MGCKNIRSNNIFQSQFQKAVTITSFPFSMENPEAHRRCSVKTVFSKVLQKTPVLKFLFNKAAGLQAYYFIKKRLQHRYFLVNFAKILRAPFFTEYLCWLLLKSILHWRGDAN